MKGIFSIIGIVLILLGLSASAHARLVDMGDETIYDTDTQLTWLKDAEMGGTRIWLDAMAWAENLVFAGFDNWRLPLAVPSPGGPNITTYNWTESEMGHLYYTELKNMAAMGGPAPPLNSGPFTNLHQDAFWSGTDAGGPFVWAFNFSGGGQNGGIASQNSLGAWAVREGYRFVPVPDDTMSPTGSVHAYPNIISAPNGKMVTITLVGYVIDEMSIVRDDGGIGVSNAYLMVDGVKIILRDDSTDLLSGDGSFRTSIWVKAKKGSTYKVELYAADTKPSASGGPNSGLVDSTFIVVKSGT